MSRRLVVCLVVAVLLAPAVLRTNRYSAKVIARPTDAAGYVDLEAGSPLSWENCAGSVRAVVLHFIRAHLASTKRK